jgi:glycosyltransferase involved in cell wall biosynthesis
MAASLSIVVPMYREQDAVAPMVQRVGEALAGYSAEWELIVVDDGSSDDTFARLRAAQEHEPRLTVLRLSRNYGQTAAMQAGIDAARYEVIATLDGDLQNDPADIPAMVAALDERGLDVLCGWRKDRQDAAISRKLPSRIANALIRRVTKVRIHDYGCSLKVYRASVIKAVRLYGEMHRFIPVWAAQVTSPARIGEMPVAHHPRTTGESKYGISRTFRVILDLVTVFFFLRFSARPGHFFGAIGLALLGVGGVLMTYLLFIKLALGQPIGQRPLLIGDVLLLVFGIQFLTTGVLAEIVTRTYFSTGRARAYVIAEDLAGRARPRSPAIVTLGHGS